MTFRIKHLFTVKFGIFLLLFFTSCTVQKRTFNKGYFVQWTTKGSKGVNFEKRSVQNASSELAKTELKDEKVEENQPINEIISRDEIGISEENQVVFQEEKNDAKPIEKNQNLKKQFPSFLKNVHLLHSKVWKSEVKKKVKAKRGFLRDITLAFYLMMAIALLLGILFLILAFNSVVVLDTIFLIVSFIFFIAAVVFLCFALFFDLLR